MVSNFPQPEPVTARPVPAIERHAACPLCHTIEMSLSEDALAAGGGWRCTVCGQRWDAPRLATVAAYALTFGNAEYKKGTASKAVADYQRALKYLYFSDSTAATGNSKFLIGVSNLQMVQPLLEDASTKKSCESAKGAQNALAEAQIYAPQGGREFPKEVTQVMTAAQQLAPYVERSVKALCK